MPRAGTAYIRVEGDFTKFHAQVRTATATAGKKINVKAKVDVDDKGLRQFNSTLGDTDKRIVGTERRVKRFGGSITGLNSQMAFLRNVFRIIKWPAVIAGFGTAAEAASALGAGVVSLTSALAPLTGILATLPAGLLGFGQAAGVLTASLTGIGDALDAMNNQQVQSAQNAKDTAEAQRTAARQISDAQRTLADAHRSEQDAQEDLTAAHEEARLELIDLRFAAEETALSQKRATLDLREARNELQRLTTDATSTANERRNAALDVEEAELRVREARSENNQTQKDLNESERKGIEGSDQVVAAKEALADAERQSADAARELARAQADAARSIAETSTETQKLQDVMGQLPPSAQHFARFLYDLKPALDDIRERAADGLLPGAEQGITFALRNLPHLKDVVDVTADSFGDIAVEAGKFLGRDGLGRDFEKIGRANARRFEDLAEAGFDFGDAVRHIAVAAEPLTDFLTDQTVDLAEWAKEAAKAGRRGGGLADFFEETRDVFKDVRDLGTDLGEVFINIGKAAFPTGKGLLDDLVKSTGELSDWTASESGQRSLRAYFEEARPAIEESAKLVADITQEFFNLAKNPNLDEFIRTIRRDLVPLLFNITQDLTLHLGPELIELFQEFAQTMDDIGTPALTAFVDLVTKALSIINDLFGKIPGLASVAATAFAGFSLVRLLGLTELTRRGAVAGLIKGVGTSLADAFGVELASAESRVAWQNASTLLKERLRGAMKYALSAGLAAVGFVEIIQSAADQDWRQAGFQAGGAIAGAIAGGIAGGLPGAMAGAGIGAMIGGIMENTFDEAVKAVSHVEVVPLVDRLVLAVEDWGAQSKQVTEDIIADLKGTDEAVDKHVIQQWVVAGDITVEQAGRMIEALKNVNQEAAHIARLTAERTGVGLGQQLAEDGKITTDEIGDIFNQLEAFKPKARKAALEAMVGWLDTLRNMGQLSGSEFQQILNLAEDKFGKIDNTLKGHGKDAADSLRKTWKGAFDDFDKHGGKLEESAKKHYGSVNSIMSTQTDKGADAVDENMARGTKEGSESARQLNHSVSASVDSVADAVFDGFKNIGDNTINALKTLDVKKQPNFNIKPPPKHPGPGPGIQTGGAIVPGNLPGDRHVLSINGSPIARVESGELISVVNRTGAAAMMDWNSKIPRRMFGGLVDVPGFRRGGTPKNDVGNLRSPFDVMGSGPGFVPLMNFLNATVGSGKLVVISGLRPGSTVAGTGTTSNHAYGNAVDISTPSIRFLSGTMNQLAQANAREVAIMDATNKYLAANFAPPVGLDQLWRTAAGGGHWNHIHKGIAERYGQDAAAMIDYIGTLPEGKGISAMGIGKAPRLMGPAGPFRNVGRAALGTVHNAARKYVAKLSGARLNVTGGGGNVPVGAGVLSKPEVRSLIDAHPPLPNWSGWIVEAESSRNPNAKNPSSSASGLWQILADLHAGLISRFGGDVFDPNVNTAVAAELWSQSGSAPWAASQGTWGPHAGQAYKLGGLLGLAEGGVLDLRKFIDRINKAKGPGQIRSVSSAGVKQIKSKTELDFLSDDGGALAGPLEQLRTLATEYADNASFAQIKDSENPITGAIIKGLFHGHTEEEWLVMELLQLGPLRNQLLTAMDEVKLRGKIVKELIKKIKGPKGLLARIAERIKEIQQFQRQLIKERDDIQDALGDAPNKPPKNEKELTQRLDEELAKPYRHQDHGRVRNLLGQLSRGTLMTYRDKNRRKSKAAREALEGRTTVKSTLKDSIAPALVKRGQFFNTGGDTLVTELDTVQGTSGDPIFKQQLDPLPWLELKGDIFDAQSRLHELGLEALTPAGTSEFDQALLEAQLAAAQERARDLARSLAISQAQLPVFQEFGPLFDAPFGGSFAEGGIVPGPQGAPRTIIAHGGEAVGQPVEHNVMIVVEEGAGVDPQKIRVVVDDRLAHLAHGGPVAGRKAAYYKP